MRSLRLPEMWSILCIIPFSNTNGLYDFRCPMSALTIERYLYWWGIAVPKSQVKEEKKRNETWCTVIRNIMPSCWRRQHYWIHLALTKGHIRLFTVQIGQINLLGAETGMFGVSRSKPWVGCADALRPRDKQIFSVNREGFHRSVPINCR